MDAENFSSCCDNATKLILPLTEIYFKVIDPINPIESEWSPAWISLYQDGSFQSKKFRLLCQTFKDISNDSDGCIPLDFQKESLKLHAPHFTSAVKRKIWFRKSFVSHVSRQSTYSEQIHHSAPCTPNLSSDRGLDQKPTNKSWFKSQNMFFPTTKSSTDTGNSFLDLSFHEWWQDIINQPSCQEVETSNTNSTISMCPAGKKLELSDDPISFKSCRKHRKFLSTVPEDQAISTSNIFPRISEEKKYGQLNASENYFNGYYTPQVERKKDSRIPFYERFNFVKKLNHLNGAKTSRNSSLSTLDMEESFVGSDMTTSYTSNDLGPSTPHENKANCIFRTEKNNIMMKTSQQTHHHRSSLSLISVWNTLTHAKSMKNKTNGIKRTKSALKINGEENTTQAFNFKIENSIEKTAFLNTQISSSPQGHQQDNINYKPIGTQSSQDSWLRPFKKTKHFRQNASKKQTGNRNVNHHYSSHSLKFNPLQSHKNCANIQEKETFIPLAIIKAEDRVKLSTPFIINIEKLNNITNPTLYPTIFNSSKKLKNNSNNSSFKMLNLLPSYMKTSNHSSSENPDDKHKMRRNSLLAFTTNNYCEGLETPSFHHDFNNENPASELNNHHNIHHSKNENNIIIKKRLNQQHPLQMHHSINFPTGDLYHYLQQKSDDDKVKINNINAIHQSLLLSSTPNDDQRIISPYSIKMQTSHALPNNIPALNKDIIYSFNSYGEYLTWLGSLRNAFDPWKNVMARRENNLQIWILEAKGIPAKKSYFCEIYLDDHFYGRTSAKPKSDLCFWGETFDFTNLPPVNWLTVKIFRGFLQNENSNKSNTTTSNSFLKWGSSKNRKMAKNKANINHSLSLGNTRECTTTPSLSNYLGTKPSNKHRFIGSVRIPIQSITGSQFHETWYSIKSCNEQPFSVSKSNNNNNLMSTSAYGLSLTPPLEEISPKKMLFFPSSPKYKNTGNHQQQNTCSIRIKARYQTFNILPLAMYSDFLQLLLDDYPSICQYLESCISIKAKEDLSASLVNIFENFDMAETFLTKLVEMEIEKIENENLTFRGNSLATKAVEAYMKFCGKDYLTQTLAHFIRVVLDTGDNCEVDPARLKFGSADYNSTNAQHLLFRNQQNLMLYCEMCWRSIVNSYAYFPKSLKRVFHSIRERLTSLGYKPEMSANVISASIFLRFLCPAILSPSLFGLCQQYPGDVPARNLTLIAKTIQTLANSNKFGGKEHYMTFMNYFVERESSTMKLFLHKISSQETASSELSHFLQPPPFKTSNKSGDFGFLQAKNPKIDIGKELSFTLQRLIETLETEPTMTSYKTATQNNIHNIDKNRTSVNENLSSPKCPNNFAHIESKLNACFKRIGQNVQNTDLPFYFDANSYEPAIFKAIGSTNLQSHVTPNTNIFANPFNTNQSSNNWRSDFNFPIKSKSTNVRERNIYQSYSSFANLDLNNAHRIPPKKIRPKLTKQCSLPCEEMDCCLVDHSTLNKKASSYVKNSTAKLSRRNALFSKRHSLDLWNISPLTDHKTVNESPFNCTVVRDENPSKTEIVRNNERQHLNVAPLVYFHDVIEDLDEYSELSSYHRTNNHSPLNYKYPENGTQNQTMNAIKSTADKICQTDDSLFHCNNLNNCHITRCGKTPETIHNDYPTIPQERLPNEFDDRVWNKNFIDYERNNLNYGNILGTTLNTNTNPGLNCMRVPSIKSNTSTNSCSVSTGSASLSPDGDIDNGPVITSTVSNHLNYQTSSPTDSIVDGQALSNLSLQTQDNCLLDTEEKKSQTSIGMTSSGYHTLNTKRGSENSYFSLKRFSKPAKSGTANNLKIFSFNASKLQMELEKIHCNEENVLSPSHKMENTTINPLCANLPIYPSQSHNNTPNSNMDNLISSKYFHFEAPEISMLPDVANDHLGPQNTRPLAMLSPEPEIMVERL